MQNWHEQVPFASAESDASSGGNSWTFAGRIESAEYGAMRRPIMRTGAGRKVLNEHKEACRTLSGAGRYEVKSPHVERTDASRQH